MASRDFDLQLFFLLVSSFAIVQTAMKASMVELMALNGQSVSYAVLQCPVGTFNLTHTHPRSAELLFLIDGTLQVGSANAGTVSIPSNLFTTGIDENVLVKSFKTDVATTHKLKAGLVPNPRKDSSLAA